MTTTHGTRLPHLDVLRGAAIIGVVYLHAYFTPWPEASRGGLVGLHAAHLVAHGAVPLFLFISAYLQARGERETPAGYLRRRFWSTWAPALIWMMAALGYRLATHGSSTDLWRDLALFNISGQFYFIWLLLVFGVVLTQGWRLSLRQVWMLAGVALAANLATVAWYEHREIGGTLATLAYRNPLAWAFFPALGYAFGRSGIVQPPRAVTLAAAAAMVPAAAAYFLRGIVADTWPASYFGVSVFLFNAAGMIVYTRAAIAVAGRRQLARPFLALAPYAYPIFLVHLPFVMRFGTHELLGEGADWKNYWLLLHANAAVGLLVSLAIVREVERLLPRAAPWLIGARRGGRRRPGAGRESPHARARRLA